MNERARIASLGAGRMGRGIAVAFAYAGHAVTLVDFKPRDAASFAKLADRGDGRGARHAHEPRAHRAV